jgi:uncharacterized protein YjbI with pentapeptide repeats
MRPDRNGGLGSGGLKMADYIKLVDRTLDGSEVRASQMRRCRFVNLNMTGTTFENINFSDITVKYAQFGGAKFTFIGLPPDARERGEEQRPVHFEHFDLNDSIFDEGNLRNVQIRGCTLDGMRIDGVLVTDMIAAYAERHGRPADGGKG